MGEFMISDVFKITGRGVILAGQILEGEINKGDSIKLTETNKDYLITAVDFINGSNSKGANVGLVIYSSEWGIEKLLAIKPQKAIIFSSEK